MLSCSHVFSVINLHDRWVKDCATYRELYDKVQNVDLTQKIDWGPLLDEKLVSSKKKKKPHLGFSSSMLCHCVTA